MGQDSAKLAILGSTWEVLGACWEHFGSILAHGLDGRKPTKTQGKHRFFGILGCLKRWLKHFFGDVGSKMAFFGHLESTCGTCWRQDGQQFDSREPGVLGPLKGFQSRSIEAQKLDNYTPSGLTARWRISKA